MYTDMQQWADIRRRVLQSGAPAYKARHPAFELWSQGVHARAALCANMDETSAERAVAGSQAAEPAEK